MDRRKFLERTGIGAAAAGAVWAAPSVIGLNSAWAWGSCTTPPVPFPAVTADTNSAGWTRAIAYGAFTSGSPFHGTYGYLGIRPDEYLSLGAPVFLVEDDPTTVVNVPIDGGTFTEQLAIVTYTRSIPVTPGQTYRFTFSTAGRSDNPGAQILDVIVGGTPDANGAYTNGVGVMNRFTTDSGSPTFNTFNNPSSVTRTNMSESATSYTTANYAALPGVTSVNFVYQFALNTVHSQQKPSDDIGVTAPTIECSLTGN